MANKTKIEFLNTVHSLVNDKSNRLQASCIVDSSSFGAGFTSFVVDTVNNFVAGQEVYIDDGVIADFYTIASIDTDDLKILIATDLTAYNNGAIIRFTQASELLLNALSMYSNIKRYSRVHTITGDGESVFTLPTDWEVSFSTINQIEYPVGSFPKELLSQGSYDIWNVAGIMKLKLDFVLAIGDEAIMDYDTVHSFGNTTPYRVTAPNSHYYAICWLCAAQYCLSLATAYIQSVENSIDADSTNHISKIDECRRLAKSYLGWAAGALGVDVKAIELGQLDVAPYSEDQFKDEYQRREKIFYN